MAIRAECDNCGYKYKLKDELAGRKVKCKICKAVFVLPSTAPAGPPEPAEESPSGQPVYRYAERPTQFEFAVGDSENIERISEHIEQHCGPVETVMHELVSDMVHIDVHVVKPTPERNYYTLVTSGMGDRPMAAPEGAEELRFAELMLSLPPDWKLDEASLEDGANYWPIYVLKMMARFPHEYQTWLSWGHTLPNGDPAEPYAENTKLCCALLLSPILPDEGFSQLVIDDEKTIHFFSIVPIYQEEIDLKLSQGTEPLVEKFAQAKVSELLDIRRVNVCKKRSWW
jgi:predicted Zn finger-like uncharacterized protein